jgi:ribosomal protein S18 acetylase RimI-like enzyme
MAQQIDEVTVRVADVSDADAIARVHVRSWQEAYVDILPADYLHALDPQVRAERWARDLHEGRHQHVRTWLAQSGPDVVGFLTLGPSRDEDAGRHDLEIYSVYLDPGTWGKGVARDLLRTVVSEVDRRASISLWVAAENERARHFYRRNGFHADGTERFESIAGIELLEVRYRRPAAI